MSEPHHPKSRICPLSAMTDGLDLLRVRCATCKLTHVYYPADPIQILGDVDVDSLMGRMSCKACGMKRMDVRVFLPSGPERVGLRIRKLVSIRIERIPVWRED